MAYRVGWRPAYFPEGDQAEVIGAQSPWGEGSLGRTHKDNSQATPNSVSERTTILTPPRLWNLWVSSQDDGIQRQIRSPRGRVVIVAEHLAISSRVGLGQDSAPVERV